MFPIRDNTARRAPAWVSWTLIGWNALVFLYQASLSPPALERFLVVFALIPSRYFGELAAVVPPVGVIDYLPFATNIFLHGGWLHLLLNMWMLWVFGHAVEHRLGAVRFLGFYLVVGIVASLSHALINAHSEVPTLGASGAIAGVIGCYIRMCPFGRLVVMIPILFFPVFFEIPAILFALFWMLTQILPAIAAVVTPADGGGIAWWAHIGGFAAGWLLTPWVRRRKTL